VSVVRLSITTLNPSKVALPFAWNTPEKLPEAVYCLPVSDTAYVPVNDAELQVPPPIWGWAAKGATGSQEKANSAAYGRYFTAAVPPRLNYTTWLPFAAVNVPL
jgi:hypothetical protein